MKKLKKFFIVGLSILSICATTVPLVALVLSCSATTIDNYLVDPNFILYFEIEGTKCDEYIVEHKGYKCLMLPEANGYIIDINSKYYVSANHNFLPPVLLIGILTPYL